jgi:hypothetical protein
LWAAAASEVVRPAEVVGWSAEHLDAQSPAQDYFRIRTTPDLPADIERRQIVRVIRDIAGDLIDAPLAAGDIERLTAALSVTIETLQPLAGVDRSMQPNPDAWPRKTPSREMWIRRWLVAHQLHALLNLFAAAALAAATASVRAGAVDDAAGRIDTARRFVEAFPAARALALALPRSFYQETLRPLMLPPLTTAPLSGKMHIEYATYRKTLAVFLDSVPETCTALAALHPLLALSREHLLEADLVDAERHVTSVEPHVGADRSLVRSSKSTENAVSVLRRIRHERAARYAPFLRFPERWSHERRSDTAATSQTNRLPSKSSTSSPPRGGRTART